MGARRPRLGEVMSSSREKERQRKFAVGLYKQHKAGATVRELAQLHDKPAKWISARLKIGERFAESQP